MIADLCANGILLTDDGSGGIWQSGARTQMAQRPRPLTCPERDSRRYSLSALIDDLSGSKSGAEAFMLSADTFHDAADLLLLETGGWLGGGPGLQIPSAIQNLSLFSQTKCSTSQAAISKRASFAAG